MSRRPNKVLAFREWDSKRHASTTSNSSSTSNGTTSKAPRRDFLEARQISLYELFDGSQYQLDVPEYQRPYAWRAKQVQELLADLHAAYLSGQEYFLGNIVTTRQGSAAGEPYWIIDGQQRLTTLVMLLGYLRAWAAEQQDLGSLAERVERMLHIPADPLNPAAKARYRLLLRSSDQQFFVDNFITSYLPTRYSLSTQLDSPANSASNYHEAAATAAAGASAQQQQQQTAGAGDSAAAAVHAGSKQQQQQQQGGQGVPLSNETWWRLYGAGDVLACYLASAMQQGLNLQDFMHHVLRNCMVVLMIARDEGTSFKIFSTLNGRGVDLAVVDKLKPELLQALPAHQRQSFADRWSVLEAALGRPSFHALFDHYITVEQATAAAQDGSSSSSSNGTGSSSNGAGSSKQNSSWAHTSDQSASSSSSSSSGSIVPFIPVGSSLMHAHAIDSSNGSSNQHQQHEMQQMLPGMHGVVCAAGQQQRHDVLQQLTGRSDVEGVLSMVLEYGQQLLQIRANDWSALEAEGGTAPAIAAELSEACFFINLLADDAWQPWALEFFYQSADDAKRAAFLRGAELLSLFCELKQDEGFKRERWLAVGAQLLQRPFYSDQVLSALALSPDEADEFVVLLGSRELAAAADERLLTHLLLRADSINRKALHWRRLKVERIVPTQPPKGSQWRRQKLLLPALSDDEAAAAASSSSTSTYHSLIYQRGKGSGGSGGSSRRSRSRTSSTSSSAASGSLAVSSGDEASASSNADSQGAAGSSSSSNVPPGMREVLYWHEMTRSHWVNRLGNLVLLQPSGQQSAATAHLSADLATKLQHYRACAADEHFPEFTGGLLSGRYSRDMFCPEECRQRHGDIITRLIDVFRLYPGGL
uniref:GmrSD restriction endonucleases N-terminal domain-containing protein n=1 Tax=Tetradesmus obliquus TaxID=3088 RepID=A0A383VA23_TETOB|eukprot:jgi/Sobl393_1/10645/SZX74680.1